MDTVSVGVNTCTSTYAILRSCSCPVNGVALHSFSKLLRTCYADHEMPLKGRPPQSPDELQLERKT